MLVLTNATPLIALAQCALFDVLQGLYGRLVLPPAVYREVVTEGQGRAGAQETATAITAGWIAIMPLQTPQAVEHLRATYRLGEGESAVLALAQEHRADLLLLDEAHAVRCAHMLQFRVLRTVGVLLQAKAQGIIPTVQTPLQILRASGFRLSDNVYHAALRYAGEVS